LGELEREQITPLTEAREEAECELESREPPEREIADLEAALANGEINEAAHSPAASVGCFSPPSPWLTIDASLPRKMTAAVPMSTTSPATALTIAAVPTRRCRFL
jgi:hypothetical protein